MQLLAQVLITTTTIQALFIGSAGVQMPVIESDIEEILGNALAQNKSIVNIVIGVGLFTAEQIRPVLSILQHNQNLKQLQLFSLPGQCSDASSFVPFSVFLVSNKTPAVIWLRNCLNSASLIEIAKGLANNTSVTALTLEGCSTQGGIAALCDSLSANTTLQQLRIIMQQMSVEECHHISHWLQNNCSLTELELVGTRLDDACANKLAEIWSNNTTSIHTVKLSANRITIEGAKVLAEVWASSSALRTIELVHNPMAASDEYQHVLSALVRRNQFITRVECEDWNDVAPAQPTELLKLCEHNKQRKVSAINTLIAAQTLQHSSMRTLVPEDVWPQLLYWSQTCSKDNDLLLTREQVTRICVIAKQQKILELNKDGVLRQVLKLGSK